MKKIFIILMSTLMFFTASICSAFADLDGFLFELGKQARADMPGYHSALSRHFNVPLQKIDRILKRVDKPADAFMCLQMALMTGMSMDQVFNTYTENRGKGWGVMAMELGIKPGSPEFHALKRGEFFFWDINGNQKTNKPGQGKGQGKGKAKGKGKKF